jgi:hypothetical protein
MCHLKKTWPSMIWTFQAWAPVGWGRKPWIGPPPWVFERNRSLRNERNIPNVSNKIILVSRILIRWLAKAVLNGFSVSVQANSLAANLENWLLHWKKFWWPSCFQNYLSITQVHLIRGYVSTITYALYNIVTVSHLSFTLEIPTKQHHPYQITIISASF